MDIAVEIHDYDKYSFSNVRASILNSAFRLQVIVGNVTTTGELGKKEKFLVPTTWLNEKGQLPQVRTKWLKETMNFTPEL